MASAEDALLPFGMREVRLPEETPTLFDESKPPFRDLRFLIVDDNPDGRFLISKTLLRKFPKAVISECQSGEPAIRILKNEPISMVISHRTYEFDAISLVREFRKYNSAVPILMMSGIDRRNEAILAGANAFLTYDEWLMVGNHVAALLTNSAKLPLVEVQSRHVHDSDC